MLAEYEQHGRLRGGTAEEATEQAYRGWLADYLDGKGILLLARTEEHARELSRRAARPEGLRPPRTHVTIRRQTSLRGVRDILTWVLGETPTSPLCHPSVGLPTTHDLTHEETAAADIVLQGRPGGHTVDPTAYPPPQYGEAIKATIAWLRGETTKPPTDHNGHSPYSTDHQSSIRPG